MREEVSVDISYKNVFPSTVTLFFNGSPPPLPQAPLFGESILSRFSVDVELACTPMLEN